MVTKSQIIKKIKSEKDALKISGVNKIGLFGSFLKNKQKKNSDVDILTEFDDLTFDNYMKVFYLLEKITKRKVDLVIESDLKPELNYIKKEVKYVKI